ncbi:MAG: tripartite tricarboxylate transporter TctB family protein [bacterium]|nr:MAG: tripartite tricarboxylate transporter TctB family protein [bacterium]
MKKGELILAAVFGIVALICIGESIRLGFGWEEWGPKAGFVIFWLGLLLLVSSGSIFIKELRKKAEEPFFISSRGMWEAIRVLALSIGLTVAISYLGVYISTFIFCAIFSRWLGKHRWPAVVAFTFITTLAVYFGMEKGLSIALPKSPLYYKGLFIF